MADHYRLLGGPGSPYSLKMRAVLRYRRLPHTWNVPRGYLGSAPELQKAVKGMIPVMQIPEGDYWADTTPMIYELEKRHAGEHSVISGRCGSRLPLPPHRGFRRRTAGPAADRKSYEERNPEMVALAKKLARYPVNGRKRHGVRSAFLFGGLFDAATTRQIKAASPIG